MPHHIIRGFTLQSGITVPELVLSYELYGSLNAKRDNLVVFPTYFTGRQHSNLPYFGKNRALDPARHCILVPCLIGNSDSSSPSTTEGFLHGANFPRVTIHDNVRMQRILVDAVCPVEKVALVIGWSMGGCQAYEWAVQFPDFIERLLPFCATAQCSPHNYVFLEGVKAALTADDRWKGGRYTSPPEKGLRAFGRSYAGWAYSSVFFNEGEYRARGFESIEALLADWEKDHLTWDANDLLCKLWAWQNADVSANDTYKSDLPAALGAVSARTIVMPSSTDMYFTAEHAKREASMLPRAEFRPFESNWGHCACTPSAPAPGFTKFLDTAIADLLSR